MPTNRLAIALAAAVLTGPSDESRAGSSKVLVIGVDGAGGRYVPLANTPNLDALVARGTGRFDFLNEGAQFPSPPEAYGASGVNWSTILTGVGADKHGVSDNSFAGRNFGQWPHFFERLKQADPSLYTASIVNWTPLNTFVATEDATDFRYSPTSGTDPERDVQVANQAVSLLQSGDPDAVFLHFDQVDGAGHASSWGSASYLAAISTVDGLIGQVLDAMNQRPGVVSGEENWLVIVTADHGGAPGAFSHVASQGLSNWQTPFLLAGPDVAAGAPMQQGSLRDVAATALWHMGVDPFLAGIDGTIRGVTITPPTGVAGDLNGDGVLSGDGSLPPEADDVSQFLAHWLARGGGGVAERYGRGDVNLDGVTDLADWALLSRLDPAMGAAIARGLSGVPEPAAALLAAAASAAAPRRRSRPEHRIACRDCAAWSRRHDAIAALAGRFCVFPRGAAEFV